MIRKITALALILSFVLSGSISAQTLTTPQINRAYPKGSTYDLVVKYIPNTKLSIYIDGHRKTQAKFNKQGWGTFKKLSFTAKGTVHFAKFSLTGYKTVGSDIGYVKNGTVVSFTKPPKYTFDEFGYWLRATQPGNVAGYDSDTYGNIIGHCGANGDWKDSQWVACMQNAFSKYLKPATFTSDDDINAFLNMVAAIQTAPGGIPSQTQDKSAQYTYVRLATTN